MIEVLHDNSNIYRAMNHQTEKLLVAIYQPLSNNWRAFFRDSHFPYTAEDNNLGLYSSKQDAMKALGVI